MQQQQTQPTNTQPDLAQQTTGKTTVVKDYSRLSAAFVCAICIAAGITLFALGLAKEHDTAVFFLAIGAWFAGAKAIND